jgi:hypothetical protein
LKGDEWAEISLSLTLLVPEQSFVKRTGLDGLFISELIFERFERSKTEAVDDVLFPAKV